MAGGNEDTFVQLDDRRIGQNYQSMNRIQLQPHTNTENILF